MKRKALIALLASSMVLGLIGCAKTVVSETTEVVKEADNSEISNNRALQG